MRVGALDISIPQRCFELRQGWMAAERDRRGLELRLALGKFKWRCAGGSGRGMLGFPSQVIPPPRLALRTGNSERRMGEWRRVTEWI